MNSVQFHLSHSFWVSSTEMEKSFRVFIFIHKMSEHDYYCSLTNTLFVKDNATEQSARLSLLLAEGAACAQEQRQSTQFVRLERAAECKVDTQSQIDRTEFQQHSTTFDYFVEIQVPRNAVEQRKRGAQ